MISVPVAEAKRRMSELLDQAQRGKEITITRDGTPVARLVSALSQGADAEVTQGHEVAAAFEAPATLRRGVTLERPLREAIEYGRD